MFAVVAGGVCGTFAESAAVAFANLAALKAQRAAQGKTMVWARVFLSDIINQLPQASRQIESLAQGCAVSVVEQASLDASRISIMACFLGHAAVERIAPDAWHIDCEGRSYIYHALRFSASQAAGADAYRQTVMAFEAHKKLLAEKAMTISGNTLRTWLFCRDIDHTYAAIVKGRNDFFAANGLTSDTHFIASTGIGGYTPCTDAVVGVDFLSREGSDSDVQYLQALDYLNPTAQYGVAFERGTAFTAGSSRVSLISGTASIDNKGRCINLNDAAAQTARLIENTAALLADAGATTRDLKMMIFYLRDAADRESVERTMREKLGDVPAVFTKAKVCRPGWLVEAESIAVRKTAE